MSVVDDVISGGHDDDDRIHVSAVDVSMESDDVVVALHDIEGDVSGFAHEIECEFICTMIVCVAGCGGCVILTLLGHGGMGLSC